MPKAEVVAAIADPTSIAQAATNTLNHEALATDSGALTTLNAAQMMVVEHQEIFKLIGRLEAAEFFRNISEKLMIDLYEKARSAFTALGEVTYRLPNGTVTRFANVNEFCRAAFHRSERRVQQIASSSRMLGEELYAQSREMGLRERDYRAIKALPAPEQQAVREAIEANDKQAVMDIIQAIAERQTELERANKELIARDTAKNKLMATKDRKINDLTEAEERRRSGSPDEKRQAVMDDLQSHTYAAEAAFRQLVGRVAEVMSSATDEACLLAARQSLDYVARVLVDAAESQNITLDLETDVTPAHMQMFKDIVQASRAADKPTSGA